MELCHYSGCFLVKVLLCADINSTSWLNDGKEMQKQPLEMFFRKSVLKNFAIFTGKHLCWCLFFNKVAGLSKKDSNTGDFL